MNQANAILDELRSGFADLFEVEPPAPDADLIDGGILDSFQVVELLAFLDERFGVAVEIEAIDLDDLRTLERLARLVVKSRH